MTNEDKGGQVIASVPSNTHTLCPSSTSEVGIYEAMVLYFQERFPNLTVVRGQINRVSLPKKAPFVLLQIIDRKRLSTNETAYDSARKYTDHLYEVMLRLDFWGSVKCPAADLSTRFSTLWNDDSTYDLFKSMNAPLFPLYTDEDQIIPLIDGEDQYEDRYSRNAYLSYSPQVGIKQDSATELIMSVNPANAK